MVIIYMPQLQTEHFFKTLTSEFHGKDIVSGRPYLRTFEGFGDKIITTIIF